MEPLSLNDTRTDLIPSDTGLIYRGVVPEVAIVRARRRPCDGCGRRRVLYNVRKGAKVTGPWRCRICAGL